MGSLAFCLSDGEAILESARPLQAGSAYRLNFDAGTGRILVRALVRYCHLMPGSPHRFEIGLTLPSRQEAERLAALSRSSPGPLPLLGLPRLVADAEEGAAEPTGDLGAPPKRGPQA